MCFEQKCAYTSLFYYSSLAPMKLFNGTIYQVTKLKENGISFQSEKTQNYL